MKFLMLSCLKTTELVEKKNFSGLSLKEKVQLSIHKRMCGACAEYEKQSKFIDNFMKRHIHNIDDAGIPQSQNDELKEKIKSKL